jgi:hypothetical protein
MANTFTREAQDGGDNGVWASFEEAQNAIARALISAYLYDDAGALKLSTGRVGLDNGSNRGVVSNDTIVTASLVGLTASCWAKIEVSVVGTTPSFTIASIAGETDPAVLPASFTAAYDGAKGGYYITATKRLIGLAWINAGGALEGIVNCGTGTNYSGYSTSDDALDLPHYFLSTKSILPITSIYDGMDYYQAKNDVFTADGLRRSEVYPVTTGAANFAANIPAAADWANKRIKIIKVDPGAGVCTILPNGAETLGVTGATAFRLRAQGDYIILESDGVSIYVVDSLSTIYTAALAAGGTVNTAHGIGVQPRIKQSLLYCINADNNFATGDKTTVLWTRSSREVTISADATNIIANMAALPAILNKTTAAIGTAGANNWKWEYILKI